MTELEKCKKGMHAEVDLNRLGEELAEENRVMLKKYMHAARSCQLESLRIEEYLTPAFHMMLALNTFLCRVGIKDPLIPHFSAALLQSNETILGCSFNEASARKISSDFVEALRDMVTTYAVPVKDERYANE